jgi:hypothetical protein
MPLPVKRPKRARAPSFAEDKLSQADIDAWWDAGTQRDTSAAILTLGRQLESEQGTRLLDLRLWRANYEDKEQATALVRTRKGRRERLSYNVTRSGSQTACAKIAKSKPRPQFLTDDGDWEQQQRAEGLTELVAGQFELLRVYEVGDRCFFDATIAHAGVALTGIEDDKPFVARIQPRDVFFDEGESVYGDGGARSLLIRRYVDRGVLTHRYPKQKQAIRNAPAAKTEGVSRASCRALVEVWEAWHLPSGEGADDGRHVIAIEGAQLLSEDYSYERFPVELVYWDPPVDGPWGASLAQQIEGYQYEIVETLKRIRIAQKWNCAPATLVELGSQIVDGKISNDLKGPIIKYKGTPPTFVTRSAQPPEVYNWVETLHRKAFQDLGLSEMLASGTKPAGLDAAAALREYNDTTSERFSLVGSRREDFFMRLAEWLVRWNRELDERGCPVVVKSTSRFSVSSVETLKWKDVELERDAYVMRLFPVSQLPTTPSGRIQTATELSSLQGEDGKPLITGEQIMELLNIPDLRSVTSLRTAALDNARRVVWRILSGKEYSPPEPYQNLKLHLHVAQLSYNKAQNQGLAESRLEVLRAYMADLADLLAPPPPAPDQMAGGPPMGPPPGGPPGLPMPPPSPPGAMPPMQGAPPIAA